jgi:lipoyl(octanoyl) transferase
VSVNVRDIIIRDLGLCDYQETWKNMRDFTESRNESTLDEIWLLQHPAVFTQGLAGKAEHVLNPHHIPVVQTDRGGQVTYHGPGQFILYALIDLSRKQLQARSLVTQLENTVITLLSELSITAYAKPHAPGVYVDDAKICSIGLRIRRGASYHGIALNVDMDLTPFSYINPCGHKNLMMTSIRTLQPHRTIEAIQAAITPLFLKNFGYHHPHATSEHWHER